MIEEPPLLTIRRRFPRPSAAELAAFAGLPTGFVVDALGGGGGLDGAVKPIGAAEAFSGVALPCEAGPADNLAIFGALELCRAGRRHRLRDRRLHGTAVIGDLLLGMMKNRGVAAFVTDGFVRDIPGLRAVGLPCFAAGVTPNSPARSGPGTVGLPIVVGGVAVGPGDIVVGDQDGVVVVPFARIGEVIARPPGRARPPRRRWMRGSRRGYKQPDWLEPMRAAKRFRELD